MPSPDQHNGHDEQALRAELARFDTPEKRIAFLKEIGVMHHFFVSGPELAAIQAGTDQVQGALRNWQVLGQAFFGVSTAEEALEVGKRQQLHRQGIMDDRLRYRNALVTIMTQCKVGADNANLHLWKIACDAVNPPKQEHK